jgi:hypothetical protein
LFGLREEKGVVVKIKLLKFLAGFAYGIFIATIFPFLLGWMCVDTDTYPWEFK